MSRSLDRVMAYVVVACLMVFLCIATIGSVIWQDLARLALWTRYRFCSLVGDMWEVQARRARFDHAHHVERAATRHELRWRNREAAALKDLARVRSRA